jgi:hypothetical protein
MEAKPAVSLVASDFRWCALPFLVSSLCAWLNTRMWGGWPTSSRGFPFTYETWCDVVPCHEFHSGWALADALLWLCVIGALATWVAVRVGWSRTLVLVAFGALFTWLNTRDWYWEGSFRGPGFPLSYFGLPESTTAVQIGIFVLAIVVNSAVAVLILRWMTTRAWTMSWSLLVASMAVGTIAVRAVLRAGLLDRFLPG